MTYQQIGEYRVSRVGLGTVQFGMEYGISNTTGQVPFPEVIEIFTTAREQGLNFVDTAPVYGESEQTIGKALSEIGARDEFVVCTKLDLQPSIENADDREIVSAVRTRVAHSLKSLRLERLPLFLLHRVEHLTARNGIIWDCLLQEKAAGRIANLGVSVDGSTPDHALSCIKNPDVAAVQIPLNVLDYRWREAGVLAAAEMAGTAVITRSSYLKGLLAMDVDNIPGFLSDAIPHVSFISDVAREIGISVGELVLRYVFSVPGVATTIIGVDTANQFRENLAIFRKGPLPNEILARLEGRITDVPDLVLVPALWNQHQKMETYERDTV
ncbi:MAG: aldo/keto reductase [Spirochaetaceae bacterium]|nr:MAG: aldo/keto reductase [Spirochaetaceae bacterium]